MTKDEKALLKEIKARAALDEFITTALKEKALKLGMEFVDMEKPPKAKNWPKIIEVELLCESCGEKVKMPFHIKRFRAIENVEWPYYMEYMSPAMKASTCPKCRMPFRMNLPTAKGVQ